MRAKAGRLRSTPLANGKRLYVDYSTTARADRLRDSNSQKSYKMKTHELKSHQSDRELEKLLRGYVADFLAGNAAGRILDETLRRTGIGIRPLMDHLTFRTRSIDRRAEEFVRHGFELDETLEYTNWFAKVYRREGYPALFIDQAFPGERGKGSITPAWVDKFGDRHLHHVAVLVDDIDKAIAAMKENGIAFTGEVVGRPAARCDRSSHKPKCARMKHSPCSS